MIAVPTSPAAFEDAPPKIQAMSTEPSASDTAPSAGAWSTIVIVEISTFRAAICLRNAKSAIVLSGTAAVLPSSSEAFDESMPRPFFTKQSFASYTTAIPTIFRGAPCWIAVTNGARPCE